MMNCQVEDAPVVTATTQAGSSQSAARPAVAARVECAEAYLCEAGAQSGLN
jgi:hypothetical protein